MPSPSEHIVDAQREVQRKLGRNLIRIQQLEFLVKKMVATCVVEGHADDMQSIQSMRKQDVAKKTLGQVMGDLTTDYLSLPVSEKSQQQDHPGDPAKVWIRTTFRIEMSPEDHQHTLQRLAELVELRNDLVHHFIENYDIWAEEGCAKADAYLDDCFRLIDERFDELRKFAQNQQEAMNHMVSIMQSDACLDFFLHGILPDGAGIDWASSVIVTLLRDAENALAENGWTSLAKAIEYITGREPTHTPRRYGCSSWRHVLHESAMFTLRREQSVPGTPTETWYRSRQV